MTNKNIGYLICETASAESDITVINGSDRPMIEANIQDMNKKNRNTRFYSDKELKPQLNSPRIQELIKTKNMFGEAGHPNSKELSRQSTIDPKNMSHLFHKIWCDSDVIKAHITAADTAVGDDFNRLIKSGTKVSFSMRAMGSILKTARGNEVQNIRLITWDWVIYPSHAIAYMNKIVDLNEQVSIMIDGSGSGNTLILSKNESGIVVPINNRMVTDYIKEESENLSSIIESFEFMYDSITINEFANQVILNKDGDKLVVNLEKHIQDEIMNYCYEVKRRM